MVFFILSDALLVDPKVGLLRFIPIVILHIQFVHFSFHLFIIGMLEVLHRLYAVASLECLLSNVYRPYHRYAAGVEIYEKDRSVFRLCRQTTIIRIRSRTLPYRTASLHP
jgi:hypothetical protein